MSVRDALCRDCRALTSGDCGKHGEVLTVNLASNATPPPDWRELLMWELEQARAANRAQAARLQRLTDALRRVGCQLSGWSRERGDLVCADYDGRKPCYVCAALAPDASEHEEGT